jgi:chromosome segregation ATPase
MSINIKKYTKDQMAKMVEEAQEKTAALEAEIIELKNCIDEKNDLIAEYANLKAEMQRKNVALTEQLDKMNGEAINKANEIANLKADLDSAKNSAQYLNDQGQQYWRAWQASKREVADLKNKLDDTEAALGRANAELTYSVAEKNALRNDVTKMTDRAAFELGRAAYAETHPWQNLWAWVKRKLVRHE